MAELSQGMVKEIRSRMAEALRNRTKAELAYYYAMQGRRSTYTQAEKDEKAQQVRDKIAKHEEISRGDAIIWDMLSRGFVLDDLDMSDADWADYMADMDAEKKRVRRIVGKQTLTLREEIVWEASRRGIPLWRRYLMLVDDVDEVYLREYLDDIVNGRADNC